MRVIHHEHNRVYGSALINGFQMQKDLIFSNNDGDGPIRTFAKCTICSRSSANIDLVTGDKLKRGATPVYGF